MIGRAAYGSAPLARALRAGERLAGIALLAGALGLGGPPAAARAAEPPQVRSAEGAETQTTPTAPAPSPVEQTLSAGSLTTWAYSEARGPIYQHPETSARRIARVRLYTPDGFSEVYPVLVLYIDPSGREWLRVRVPGRPNGRIGWVARNLLGEFHRTRWHLLVDRARRTMEVFHAERLMQVFPVGVGKPSTPTPSGRFWIDERFKLGNPASPYWPYALGTSDYSTLPDWPGEGVIGIHGPYGEPQRIPGDPSHGCIRMLAPDLDWLAARVGIGTPVDVV